MAVEEGDFFLLVLGGGGHRSDQFDVSDR